MLWHGLGPSDRTVALGSTRHLTEVSTKGISRAVKTAGAYGVMSWTVYPNENRFHADDVSFLLVLRNDLRTVSECIVYCLYKTGMWLNFEHISVT
jgi:hypothetical protein